jgi:hypothetical protein
MLFDLSCLTISFQWAAKMLILISEVWTILHCTCIKTIASTAAPICTTNVFEKFEMRSTYSFFCPNWSSWFIADKTCYYLLLKIGISVFSFRLRSASFYSNSFTVFSSYNKSVIKSMYVVFFSLTTTVLYKSAENFQFVQLLSSASSGLIYHSYCTTPTIKGRRLIWQAWVCLLMC